MKKKRLGLISILMFLALFSLTGPVRSEEKLTPNLIARVSGACSQLSYIGVLPEKEKVAIRDILSFLYHGANALFQYPGSPLPTINDATRKSMAENSWVKGELKQKNVSDLTPQQIDEEVRRLYSIDPESWNIHKGPAAERIRQILKDSDFTKRLGLDVSKLLDERLNGGMGQRQQILAELEKRFQFKQIIDDYSSEACESTDFGPE